MILLFGPHDDPCVSRVHRTLVRRGARVAHFDADELLTRCTLSYQIACGSDEATLDIDGVRVAVDEIGAALVWVRDLPLLPADERTRDRMYRQFEWHAALGGFWELLGRRVLNPRDVAPHTRPHVGDVTRAAATAGFTLPAFAISTDRARIDAFADCRAGRVLAGSLSGAFADALSPDAERLRALSEDRAVILRSVTSGQWWRAFVIDDTVLGLALPADAPEAGTEIHTPTVEPVIMEGPTAERCRRFARTLGLDYAQLLLLRTAAGADHFQGYSAHLAIDPSFAAVIDAVGARVADLLLRRATTCEPTITPSFS